MSNSYVLRGHYFDGITADSTPAQLAVNGSTAELLLDGLKKSLTVESLVVTPRTGSADRFILFADEGQYQCADSPFLDELRQEVPSEGIVAWLESRITLAVVSVLVMAAFLGLAYVYGVPYIAGMVTSRVPMQVERRLGDYILATMDENGMLEKSNISREKRMLIDNALMDLVHGQELDSYIQVEFRKSDLFGANAFALPGGIVIVTDELVESLPSIMEVAAVLAHEAGHVHFRHGMQSLLQKSIIALVVTTVTADVNTGSSLVVSFPAMILENSYSRAFEFAADAYAATLLEQKGYPAETLADALQKISPKQRDDYDVSHIFSTHPDLEERMLRLTEKAQ